MDNYDKVNAEEIIERLKRLIHLMELEKKAKEKSNEKNIPNSS